MKIVLNLFYLKYKNTDLFKKINLKDSPNKSHSQDTKNK